MSLVSKFVKGLDGLKVKEVVPYVRKYASENLNRPALEHRITTGLNTYRDKYIDTGSAKPLWDVIGGIFIGSYIIAWPQEYRHYKAEQAAKLEGKAAH